MLAKYKVEEIAYQVIKTLYSRFEKFPEDPTGIRNAPFHMAFLNAFKDRLESHVTNIPVFISLSSWFHGLNTSLGQSFFELVSHILSDGIKMKFKELKISQHQQTSVSDIITELKNSKEKPNLERENKLIKENNISLDKFSSNFTADCYYEDEDKIVAIELKTVKPNSGVFKNEKEKFLSAKAGLQNVFPNKKIYFYLGFPFDPTSTIPTGSDKTTFMKYSVDFNKYFDPEEILLAEELWNFLSSESNTMKQILDIINDIATTDFMQIYDFLNNSVNKNSNKQKYIQCLNVWKIFSEINLINSESTILKKIVNDKRLIRIFNQPIFNNGNYNIDRKNILKELL